MDFAHEDRTTPMVWMRHGDGAPGQIPASAAEAWELLGWERCDAPPPVNPVAHPDLVPPATPPAEPTPTPSTGRRRRPNPTTTDGDQDADTSEGSEN